jgi:hypothetical protein
VKRFFSPSGFTYVKLEAANPADCSGQVNRNQADLNSGVREMSNPEGRVKSADRAIRIFEHFAEKQKPSTLTQISRELGLPVSSTFAIMRCLVDAGYMDHKKNTKLSFPR